MPQLGVLSTVHELAALQVFNRDCLSRLGWSIAPRTAGRAREGQPCLAIEFRSPGRTERHEVRFGELRLVPHAAGERATVTALPARGFDVGAGPGQPVTREIHGGVVGLILDGRGRPLVLPTEPGARVRKLAGWNRALDVYPESR